MSDLEKYDQAFVKVLGIEADKLMGITYESVSDWDSIGHMDLIAELEEAFDIMFETDDIIAFSSYEKGKELLKNYGVEI